MKYCGFCILVKVALFAGGIVALSGCGGGGSHPQMPEAERGEVEVFCGAHPLAEVIERGGHISARRTDPTTLSKTYDREPREHRERWLLSRCVEREDKACLAQCDAAIQRAFPRARDAELEQIRANDEKNEAQRRAEFEAERRKEQEATQEKVAFEAATRKRKETALELLRASEAADWARTQPTLVECEKPKRETSCREVVEYLATHGENGSHSAEARRSYSLGEKRLMQLVKAAEARAAAEAKATEQKDATQAKAAEQNEARQRAADEANEKRECLASCATDRRQCDPGCNGLTEGARDCRAQCRGEHVRCENKCVVR